MVQLWFGYRKLQVGLLPVNPVEIRKNLILFFAANRLIHQKAGKWAKDSTHLNWFYCAVIRLSRQQV
jgi:hypothetical protein